MQGYNIGFLPILFPQKKLPILSNGKIYLRLWPWRSRMSYTGCFLINFLKKDLIAYGSGCNFGSVFSQHRLRSYPAKLLRQFPIATPSILTMGMMQISYLQMRKSVYVELLSNSNTIYSPIYDPTVYPGCCLPIIMIAFLSKVCFSSDLILMTGIGLPIQVFPIEKVVTLAFPLVLQMSVSRS